MSVCFLVAASANSTAASKMLQCGSVRYDS